MTIPPVIHDARLRDDPTRLITYKDAVRLHGQEFLHG